MARFFQWIALGIAAVAVAAETPVETPTPSAWELELQDVEVQISNLKKKKKANLEQLATCRAKGDKLLKKDYTHARLWIQKARSYERVVERLDDQISELQSSRDEVLKKRS